MDMERAACEPLEQRQQLQPDPTACLASLPGGGREEEAKHTRLHNRGYLGSTFFVPSNGKAPLICLLTLTTQY